MAQPGTYPGMQTGMQPGMPMPMQPGMPMPGGPNMSPEALQTFQLDKLKKDTYKSRKAEGRPKHGQSSFSVVILGGLSWMFMAGALAMPYWRSQNVGVMGYPRKRSWGLFAVSGYQTKMWHSISDATCQYFGQLNVGGICASPICIWYRIKCETYIEMMMYNYTIGVVLIIELLVLACLVYWTVQYTPRLIRWAANWYPVVTGVHLVTVVAWILMTEEGFSALDTYSYYPTPTPSASFFFSCLVFLFLLYNTMMVCAFQRWWPEPDESSTEEDEEDEDDSSEEERKKKKKKQAQASMAQRQWQGQQQAQAYPGAYAAQQGGYDQGQVGYGQGYGSQQAYGAAGGVGGYTQQTYQQSYTQQGASGYQQSYGGGLTAQGEVNPADGSTDYIRTGIDVNRNGQADFTMSRPDADMAMPQAPPMSGNVPGAYSGSAEDQSSSSGLSMPTVGGLPPGQMPPTSPGAMPPAGMLGGDAVSHIQSGVSMPASRSSNAMPPPGM